MQIPEELLYTEEHEWVRMENGLARVGITEYAQAQLGDVVYVEMPKVGTRLAIMRPFGAVESVKAASDLYSPLTGEVVEVNARLIDEPELVNSEPYEGGWMIVLSPESDEEVGQLLTPEAYADLIADDE